MNSLQRQLTVEIEFWREMIEQQEVPFPPRSLERMEEALALAEYKLVLMMASEEAPDLHMETATASISDRRH